MIAAPYAHAQEDMEQGMAPDRMMKDDRMMDQTDMPGMMGMMRMMDQMGPMMEACTEMMQAMNDRSEPVKPAPQDG
ncbi:hypothetical protein [Paracoccus alkanivorans]|nr:hypothetical protein [Paracoccus alkanivorans]